MKEYIKELILATNLFGKANTKIAKFENSHILTYILQTIDTISSNEIESIHTTVDSAYEEVSSFKTNTPFCNYREALKNAHKSLMANEIILARDIKLINKTIRGEDGEFRRIPVAIKDNHGKVIHKPLDAQKIAVEMENLVQLINQDREKNQILNSLDIHHKFEYIHPFKDGNGRTGRILFALLLAKYEILDIPASVFSYSIMKSKAKYYEALKLADKGEMEQYYALMLKMLNDSLKMTLMFIDKLNVAKEQYEDITNQKKKEILNYLFAGVKTTNKYIVAKTGINNKTVSKYIDELVEEGIIEKQRSGKYVTYKNIVLEQLIFAVFKELK